MNIYHKAFLLVFPFVLYILALNPYLEPSTYDNIIYVQGAKSFALHGNYTYAGEYILDWPPMLSLFLAVPYFFGFTSLFAAKLFILACVCCGMWLSFTMLQQEKYEFPLFSYFLAMISPTVFIWGTRIMSEWPYLTLSLFFLYLLGKMETNQRSILYAFLTGVVFAACLLTRYVGITLLAAVGTIAIQRLLQQRQAKGYWKLSTILPEVVVAFTGVGIFALVWFIPLLIIQHMKLASLHYYHSDTFTVLHPFNLLNIVGDFFLKINHLTISQPFLTVILLTINMIVLLGIIHQVRSRGWKKTDSYVIAYLALLLVTSYSYTRYLVPLAPFLFSYLLSGLKIISQHYLSFFWQKKAFFVALVIFYFLAYDALLLTIGNLREYGGLNLWASPSPQQFYRHYWLELYELGTLLKQDSTPGAVGLIEVPDTTYVNFFSGREVVQTPSKKDFSFLIIKNSALDTRENLQQEWTLLQKKETISLYKKDFLHSVSD